MANIPIHYGSYKNIEDVGMRSGGVALMDGYVDEAGNVNRRPGCYELCDLGTSKAIDGLYWWNEQEKVVAISDGEAYFITDKNGTNTQITGTDAFQKLQKPTYADFGTDLYSANGGKVMAIASAGTMAHLTDADAPTTVSHVAYINKYLLANEVDSDSFHWSDTNDPTEWGGNYAEAEVKEDNLMALGVEYMEIFALGEQSLEIWRNDGTTPFIRELQGYVASGTIAKQSLEWCNGAWVYLDNERNVVMLEGRTPKVISMQVNAYIQGFEIVSDAVGHYVTIDSRPYYVLSFLAEQVTLVYDFISKLWYEWGYWHKASGVYQRYIGNCFCYAKDWGLTLMGDRRTGKVHVLSPDYYQDDGDEIRTLVRTGYLNHETEDVEKKCSKITLRVKRKNVVTSSNIVSLGSELVTDGAFSNWTGGDLDSWTKSNAEDVETVDSPFGGSSAKVTSSAALGGMTQTITVEANCYYTLSAYVKATSGDSGQLLAYDVTGSASIDSVEDIDDTDWMYQELEFTTPADCVSVKISLIAEANGDIIYFDKVSLKKRTLSNPDKIMVRWRDNGSTSWNRERWLDLGQVGDRDIRLQLRRLGMYYSRQWEFAITDNAQFLLCSVEEELV